MLPPGLRQGDTIAVFSPSSPATVTAQKRYLRAKRYLESKGFSIAEGCLTGKQDYYRSGTILERAEELNALLRDPAVKCVMAAIGGNHSNFLLPYLDYDALIRQPKIVIGYSDVTALLLGIYAKTGLTTYYGPAMVASFGESPYVEKTFCYFGNIVMGKAACPYVLPTPGEWTEEYLNWTEQDRRIHLGQA